MTCGEVELALASEPRAARQDASVRAHLEACEACREALRAFERIDAAIAATPRPAPRDRAAFLRGLDGRIDRDAAPRTVRWTLRAAAVAATLAIAGLAYVRSRPEEATILPPAPPAPAPEVVHTDTTAELCVRLASADLLVRREALEEAGRRPDAVSRSLLVATLRDPELAGRAAAIVGLERVREAIPALSRLAKDPVHGETAVAALAAIGGADAAAVLLRQVPAGPNAESALDALRGMGPVAQAALQERIQRARAADHEALLETVLSLHATGCLAWVTSLAERTGPLQEDAIEALGALGDARAVGTLIRVSREPVLRSLAVSALVALEESGTRELARRAAAGRREDRVRAIELLGETKGDAAVRTLVAALADPSVRVEAVRALGEAGSASAAPALAACLDDPAARSAAVAALESVADASTVPLLERLSRDASLRRDALRILGATGAPEALSPLVRALGTRETAAVAMEGLVSIGEPAIPALIRALSVRDVAPRARGALAAIATVDLGADPGAWQRWWRERRSTPNLSVLSPLRGLC